MAIKIDMPREVAMIIEKLQSTGFEAYCVGGCVRDSLLCRTPDDWDITTDALPEEIIGCFKNYTVIPTGLQHGTVTILLTGKSIEVTTFRIDGEYEDNRRPSTVAFSKSLREDIARRDFTINAIAYNHKSGIIDYFGGQEDLKAGIIRCVGTPEERFNEDALRIMRCVRFASQLGFIIDKTTENALLGNLKKLGNISAERLQVELNKALLGDYVREVFFKYYKVIGKFVPEVLPTIGFNQNSKYHFLNVWEHILLTVENSPKDIIIRLTMFLHDIGKPECYSEDCMGVGHFKNHELASEELARKILQRLKYSNKIKHNVLTLVRYHDLEIMPNRKIITKKLNKLGTDIVTQLLEVQRADVMGKAEEFRENKLKNNKLARKILEEIVAKNSCFSLRQLDIKGKDIINLGVKEGPEVGEMLQYLLNLVVTGEADNDKTELAGKASEIIRKRLQE